MVFINVWFSFVSFVGGFYMNREERRKSLKGKKKYFECPECNFKHRVVI